MKINFTSKSVVLITLSLILLYIPFSWSSENFYGGDDSRLYYKYPVEYFNNFTLSIVSNNMLGSLGSYFPQTYIAPFTLMLIGVKKVFFFLETQPLMYGVVLSLGFISFYKLLGIWIKNVSQTEFLTKVITSLMYSTSIFVVYTLWGYQLFSLYLIAVYPLCFYLFSKAVLDESYSKIVWISLIMSIFSIVVLSTPWLFALIIVSLPLIIYLFSKNPYSFIRMTLTLMILMLGLNLHWIFHIINSVFASGDGGSITSTVLSDEMRISNELTIVGVGGTNNLLYPMLNLFHKNIQIQYSWPIYSIFSNWYVKFMLTNAIFTLVIIYGLISTFGARKSKEFLDMIRLHKSLVVGWLVGLYLFTANVGPYGLQLFLNLNRHIPGFVMFRNMFDKFSLALAFIYAFTFGVSFYILTKNISKRSANILLIVATFSIVFSAIPFISGDVFKFTFNNARNAYLTINDFNRDYYDLVDYFRSNTSTGRVLWLPLTNANYTIISDSRLNNHFYIGVSPLQILSKQQDLAGAFSFSNDDAHKLLEAMKNNDYDGFGTILRKYAVDRVIINNDIPKEVTNSQLFVNSSLSFINSSLKEMLLGQKIQSFGDRYEVYELKNTYKNSRIFLRDSNTGFTQNIENVSTNGKDYSFTIEGDKFAKFNEIVFLDPFNARWVLSINNNNIYPVLSDKYAMKFPINSENLGLAVNDAGVLNPVITFTPYKYSNSLFLVAIMSYGFCIGFLAYCYKYRIT